MTHDLGQELEYRIVSQILASLPGASVIDVGAEKGGFVETCINSAARRVEAFEPLDRHFQVLQSRWAADSCVRLHKIAISDSTGYASFHLASDISGAPLDHHHTLSVIQGATKINFGSSIDVVTMTLSDACQKLGLDCAPDILKIDTEGHDLQVLSGLGNCRPRLIICEFWRDLPQTSGRCPYNLSDLVRIAKSFGYLQFFAVRHSGSLTWIDIGVDTVNGDE